MAAEAHQSKWRQWDTLESFLVESALPSSFPIPTPASLRESTDQLIHDPQATELALESLFKSDLPQDLVVGILILAKGRLDSFAGQCVAYATSRTKEFLAAVIELLSSLPSEQASKFLTSLARSPLPPDQKGPTLCRFMSHDVPDWIQKTLIESCNSIACGSLLSDPTGVEFVGLVLTQHNINLAARSLASLKEPSTQEYLSKLDSKAMLLLVQTLTDWMDPAVWHQQLSLQAKRFVLGQILQHKLHVPDILKILIEWDEGNDDPSSLIISQRQLVELSTLVAELFTYPTSTTDDEPTDTQFHAALECAFPTRLAHANMLAYDHLPIPMVRGIIKDAIYNTRMPKLHESESAFPDYLAARKRVLAALRDCGGDTECVNDALDFCLGRNSKIVNDWRDLVATLADVADSLVLTPILSQYILLLIENLRLSKYVDHMAHIILHLVRNVQRKPTVPMAPVYEIFTAAFLQPELSAHEKVGTAMQFLNTWKFQYTMTRLQQAQSSIILMMQTSSFPKWTAEEILTALSFTSESVASRFCKAVYDLSIAHHIAVKIELGDDPDVVGRLLFAILNRIRVASSSTIASFLMLIPVLAAHTKLNLSPFAPLLDLVSFIARSPYSDNEQASVAWRVMQALGKPLVYDDVVQQPSLETPARLRKGIVNYINFLGDRQQNMSLVKAELATKLRPVVSMVLSKDGRSILDLACDLGRVETTKFFAMLHPPADTIVEGDTPLHVACRMNHTRAVTLLRSTTDITQPNAKGDTPLYSACWKGHINCAKLLLERRSDLISARNLNGDTVFHAACWNGHMELAKHLYRMNNDLLYARDKSGNTAIHDACRSGRIQVISELLSMKPDLMVVTNDAGDTPLHVACSHGKLEVVNLLLDRQGNATAKNGRGSTPAHMAVFSGHIEVVRALLSRDESLGSVRNSLEQTLLHYAAWNGHLGIMQLLYEKNPELLVELDKDSKSALFFAACYGHGPVCSFILEHEPDLLNRPNASKDAPIHISCQNGHADAVKVLLAAGADTRKRTSHGFGPLHLAARQGHVAVLTALIDSGMDPNEQKEDHWSAIHLAAANHHANAVKLLLERGADPNLTNSNETPLLLAATKGDKDIVEMLLAIDGIRIETPDASGWTALLMACRNGHLEVVKMLLAKGANPNASAPQGGWSGLHLTARDGHLDVMEALLSNGANVNARKIDGWTPLHLAANNNRLDGVQLLLSALADTSIQNNEGHSALELAKLKGFDDIVRLFDPMAL